MDRLTLESISAGLGVFIAIVVVSVLLSACGAGKTHQSSQAGPTDTSPGNVSQMPSGFRNVAFKCVELEGQWFAVFSASDGGSGDNLPAAITAVPAPKCTHEGR